MIGKFLVRSKNLKLETISITYEHIQCNILQEISQVFRESTLTQYECYEKFEYRELRIEGVKNEKEANKHLIQMIKLLSFALGEHIILERALYNDNGNEYEKSKHPKTSFNSGYQIIPDFKLTYFLEKALPIWGKISTSRQSDYKAIFDYLNQTRIGYIEDRILRAAQCWEILSEGVDVRNEIPEPFIELGKELKQVYKNWRSVDKNRGYDPNGSIGSMIQDFRVREKILFLDYS